MKMRCRFLARFRINIILRARHFRDALGASYYMLDKMARRQAVMLISMPLAPVTGRMPPIRRSPLARRGNAGHARVVPDDAISIIISSAAVVIIMV